MNADEIVVWLLFLSGMIFLMAAMALIVAGALLFELHSRLQALKRRPEVPRDMNGRPIRERI